MSSSQCPCSQCSLRPLQKKAEAAPEPQEPAKSEDKKSKKKDKKEEAAPEPQEPAKSEDKKSKKKEKKEKKEDEEEEAKVEEQPKKDKKRKREEKAEEEEAGPSKQAKQEQENDAKVGPARSFWMGTGGDAGWWDEKRWWGWHRQRERPGWEEGKSQQPVTPPWPACKRGEGDDP